ncbi:MAG: autotransporter domain-containing protein [Desulfobacterales bacterium]|nr:MAG: autotransporter domain-containing protein [Desulfobacterales bacterium]
MTRRLLLIMVFILPMVFVSSLVAAATVKLPSGQVFDLTSKQLEMLKHRPGVAFFPYQLPDEGAKDQISPLIHIQLPKVLGAGFLVGTPENLTAGLHAVGAQLIKKKKADNDTTLKSTIQKHENGVIQSNVLVSVGYRMDDLDWNIAGDTAGENPNILSELTWSDLEIYQAKLRNVTIIRKIIYFRGALAYGWITGGENQDSDFIGDNRTQEFSRSNNNSDDGNIFDASLGIGHPFTFGNGKFRVTPLLGYSYHEQNLTISDGNQTIPPLGPFPNLDSTYETEWDGPWLGLDLVFQFNKKYTLFAEIEYHWADFYAVADWNLRSDLAHPKSFEHVADGNGIVVSTGWTCLFHRHWALNIAFDYQTWSTDHGIDRVFTAGGAVAETRLNEVNWESFTAMIGLAYHF